MDVCRALAALHAAGIWHGDPRLPNIVRIAATKLRAGATATRLTSASSSAAAAVDTELVWIDFRTSSHSATPFDICFDCRVLLQSFFVHLFKEDPRFDQLAKQYSAMLDTLRGGDASSLSDLSAWCQQAWRELHVALR